MKTVVRSSAVASSLFFFFCVCVAVLPSQTALPTKSLSIFKNGSCMIMKQGTLPLTNNQVRLPVPSAITSTYWLSTPGERLIKSISYKTENIKSPQPVSDMMELLELNIGKNISFELMKYGGVKKFEDESAAEKTIASTTTVSGKLLGVNKNMNSFSIADKGVKRYFSIDDVSPSNLGIEDAVDIRMEDSSARFAIITPVRPMNEMTLQEISLQGGMQWIPSYYMKLGDSKEAHLEMKALVENFSNEAIVNADAEVVVGVPQLYFSTVLDPTLSADFTRHFISTAGKATLLDNRNATQLLGNNGGPFNSNTSSSFTMRGVRGETSRSQWGVVSEDRVKKENEREDDDNNNEEKIDYAADAEQSKDIFVYKLGNISVEKESKTSFPIFSTGIEYKDIHECNIPDFSNVSRNNTVNTREESFDVFHSVELYNNTGYPLTTAGIVVTDEKNRFLAQDLLKYIPKGGKGVVHLAKALNVGLRCSEEEVQRTENVKRIAKVNYHKVRVKGTVKLQNFDEKEITVKVKKSLEGKIVVSGNGTAKKISENFDVNPQSELSWDITLTPGETKEFSYEYETLFH